VNKRELRAFGLTVGAAFAGLFGLLLPLLRHRAIPVWPWAPAIAFVMAALIAPRALYYPRLGWDVAGKIIGWVNSQIVLTLLFYGVFFPAGLCARMFGWDPMGKSFDRRCVTYRHASQRPARETIEKPY